MSAVSFGFIAIMVLIGGVVALIADNLGRRIGKKRFKLNHRIRPRHTATIFVVGAGLLIPIVTVALVSALSKDVRTWLVEGERAIADVQRLRPEVENLKTQRSNLTGELQSANEAKSSAESSAKSAIRTKDQLDKQVRDLSARAAEFRTRIGSIQNQFRLVSGKLNNKEQELTKKISALNISVANKNEIERLFKELRKQRDELNEDFIKIQRDVDSNEKLIKDQLKQIQDLNEQKGIAQRTFDEQAAALQEKIASTQKLLQDATKNLKDAEEEFNRVQGETTTLRAVNDATRKRRMIYALGDEVARIVVGEDLTTTQARNQLNTLLRSARISAEASGAKGSGRIGAAGLFDQEVDGKIVSAEQQLNELVARSAGIPQSRILVATAFWNSYVNEPVVLDIIAYPNKLSFHAGDVISEVRIDGDLSSGQVIAALGNWLAIQVKEAALKAGMVPVAGRADALANLAPEDIFELVSQIKSQSRTARVQALAFEDTFAVGPLKLAFRIR